MATNRDNLMGAAPDVLFGDVKKNWGWLLTFGILSIILGTIGLGMTFGLTLVSVLFFGALLLVGGVVQLINAFQCKGWKSVLWHAVIALLYVLGGIAIMFDPILASSVFTLMLAGALIGVGVVRIIMAFQNRMAKGWYWALIAGVISILLGVIIIAQWPISGLWVIGLFVAIELIFNGWAYVFIALAARNAAKADAERPGSAAAGTT